MNFEDGLSPVYSYHSFLRIQRENKDISSLSFYTQRQKSHSVIDIMNFNWTKISEKIISLYEEMEYHPEYNIEQFISDFKIERSKDVSIPATRPNVPAEEDSSGILQFRDVLESRRSILTKLFSLTNNINGVDILIEYCDYYKSYYDKTKTSNFPVRLPDVPTFLFPVFTIMGRNEITEEELYNVWQMLYTDIPQWKNVVFPTSLHHNDLYSGGAYPVAMVIMADSDLNAVVHALIGSYKTYFQVSRVLVQEPVKEQLLSTMKSYGCKFEILSILYVFHNTSEAVGNLNSKAISIWSENIIAAKKFAANAEIDTIWINAHGVFGAGLHSTICNLSMFNSYRRIFDSSYNFHDVSSETSSPPPPLLKSARTYDHFYGGKWQVPTNKEYWTNPAGVSFAQATDKDITNCANSARSASKLWRSKRLSQRAKVIRSFAERLRAHGESEYADIVLQFVDRPLEFGNSLSIVRDGEAEILSTPQPVGVVMIGSGNQKMLFAKLIIASVTGNAVIVLLNSRSSVSFAPYCDLLGTCGFPPGVINCLFSNTLQIDIHRQKSIDAILLRYSIIGHQESVKPNPKLENVYNDFFIAVTKPKSIWLQCC